MQHAGGPGVKEEKRKAGEGIYMLYSRCVYGMLSSVSELVHQSFHKPVTFCLLQPVLPFPPSPLPVLHSPGHSTLHRSLHRHRWKCPADGAKNIGRAGGQKAWKKEKWCLATWVPSGSEQCGGDFGTVTVPVMSVYD